jgi:hypothetical protein
MTPGDPAREADVSSPRTTRAKLPFLPDMLACGLSDPPTY